MYMRYLCTYARMCTCSYYVRMHACVYNMCTDTSGYLGHHVSMSLRALTHRTYGNPCNNLYRSYKYINPNKYETNHVTKSNLHIFGKSKMQNTTTSNDKYTTCVIKPCTKRYHPLFGSRPDTYVHTNARNRPTPVSNI